MTSSAIEGSGRSALKDFIKGANFVFLGSKKVKTL